MRPCPPPLLLLLLPCPAVGEFRHCRDVCLLAERQRALTDKGRRRCCAKAAAATVQGRSRVSTAVRGRRVWCRRPATRRGSQSFVQFGASSIHAPRMLLLMWLRSCWCHGFVRGDPPEECAVCRRGRWDGVCTAAAAAHRASGLRRVGYRHNGSTTARSTGGPRSVVGVPRQIIVGATHEVVVAVGRILEACGVARRAGSAMAVLLVFVLLVLSLGLWSVADGCKSEGVGMDNS